MAEASFQFDLSQLDRLVAGLMNPAPINTEIRVSVRTVVEAVWREATKRVKVRTGRTRSSIFHVITDGGMSGWVGPTTIGGIVLEKGARAHEIYARNAQALAIPQRASGAAGFYRSVHHPGSKPQPYLHPAMEAAGPLIEAELLRVGQVVLTAIKNGL